MFRMGVGGRILVDKIMTFKLAPVAPRSSDLQQENRSAEVTVYVQNGMSCSMYRNEGLQFPSIRSLY